MCTFCFRISQHFFTFLSSSFRFPFNWDQNTNQIQWLSMWERTIHPTPISSPSQSKTERLFNLTRTTMVRISCPLRATPFIPFLILYSSSYWKQSYPVDRLVSTMKRSNWRNSTDGDYSHSCEQWRENWFNCQIRRRKTKNNEGRRSK